MCLEHVHDYGDLRDSDIGDSDEDINHCTEEGDSNVWPSVGLNGAHNENTQIHHKTYEYICATCHN